MSSSAFWGIPAATANLHSDEVTGPTREDADEPGEGGITQSTFTLNGKTWHVGQSNWLPIHVINAAIDLSAMLAAMPKTPVTEAYHRLVQAECCGSEYMPALLVQLQNSVRDAMAKQGHYLPPGKWISTGTPEDPDPSEIGIDFLKRQAEAIAYHLSTPELIADALEAEYGDREAIIEVAQRLLEHTHRHLIPHETYETDLAKAILRDAIEGSTWFAEKTAAKKAWKISSAQYRGCKQIAQGLAQRLRDNGIDCGEMQE
jgi:hypothetical protein